MDDDPGGRGRSVVCIQAADQAAHGARRAARRAAGCDGPRRATMMTTTAMMMVTTADERDGDGTNDHRNRGAENGGAPPSRVAVTHVLGPGHEVCGDAARASSSRRRGARVVVTMTRRARHRGGEEGTRTRPSAMMGRCRHDDATEEENKHRRGRARWNEDAAVGDDGVVSSR